MNFRRHSKHFVFFAAVVLLACSSEYEKWVEAESRVLMYEEKPDIPSCVELGHTRKISHYRNSHFFDEENSRKVAIRQEMESGKVLQFEECTHIEKGQSDSILKCRHCSPGAKCRHSVYEYKHVESGLQLVSSRVVREGRGVAQQTTYQYDKKGRIAEIVKTPGTNGHEQRTTQYSYDQNGWDVVYLEEGAGVIRRYGVELDAFGRLIRRSSLRLPEGQGEETVIVNRRETPEYIKVIKETERLNGRGENKSIRSTAWFNPLTHTLTVKLNTDGKDKWHSRNIYRFDDEYNLISSEYTSRDKRFTSSSKIERDRDYPCNNEGIIRGFNPSTHWACGYPLEQCGEARSLLRENVFPNGIVNKGCASRKLIRQNNRTK